jgi:hypothetical protein
MVHAPNGTRAKWYTRLMVQAPNGTGAKWYTPPQRKPSDILIVSIYCYIIYYVTKISFWWDFLTSFFRIPTSSLNKNTFFTIFKRIYYNTWKTTFSKKVGLSSANVSSPCCVHFLSLLSSGKRHILQKRTYFFIMTYNDAGIVTIWSVVK